jgi:hypothetical protein
MPAISLHTADEIATRSPSSTLSRRTFLAGVTGTATNAGVAGGQAIGANEPNGSAGSTATGRESQRGERINVAERASNISGVSVRQTDRFTVVTPSAGVREGIRVGTNERAQNVLVDLTAEGSNFRFNIVGQNPTVRHIGFIGESTVRDEQVSLIYVAHESGTALVENIYAADGSVSSNPNDYAGCKLAFVNKNAGGPDSPVVFRRCNIGPFTDNGIYASAVGKVDDPSSKAPVTIANCYARNCGTANYRLGSDGSRLLNSVSVNNGPVPAKQGAINCRGLWAREQGTISVENCQFYHPWDGDGQGYLIRTGGGGTPDGGRVETSNVQVTPLARDRLGGGGGELDMSGIRDGARNVIPTGVPTTAERAAAGAGGSGGPIPGPSGSDAPGESGPGTGPGRGVGTVAVVGQVVTLLVLGVVAVIAVLAIAIIAWIERDGDSGDGL